MLITGLILQLALAMEPIHQTLTAPMDVWDVTAQDLDEDGLLDLVAFYGERDGSKDKKGLYVYLARRDGKYPTKPSFTFPLNADTGNAFFTERDGRRELVVSTKTGATRYVYQKNAFAEAGRYAFVSLLPAHTRKPIFLRNVSHDLDGDGSDEWIIPVLGGFDIWGGEEKMVFLEGEIHSESYWYGGLNIHHRIPRVYVFKRPGEKNQAIGFTSEDGAIMLTTISTIGALIPIIIETDLSAQPLNPMALSLACGVGLASGLTLIFIPSLFAILSDLRCAAHFMIKGNWPAREDVEPARHRNKDIFSA